MHEKRSNPGFPCRNCQWKRMLQRFFCTVWCCSWCNAQQFSGRHYINKYRLVSPSTSGQYIEPIHCKTSYAKIPPERAADISRHFINPPELIPLPPKVAATCNIHKDVSSLAKFGVENEGASEVHVAGKLHGKTQSKDAFKNSPLS